MIKRTLGHPKDNYGRYRSDDRCSITKKQNKGLTKYILMKLGGSIGNLPRKLKKWTLVYGLTARNISSFYNKYFFYNFCGT
jgi:hypothetical protein